MILNLLNHHHMKKLVMSELGLSDNDNFISDKIFNLVEELYRNENMSLEEAYSKIDGNYSVVFDFFSALKNFDAAMQNIPLTPSWAADVDSHYDFPKIENLELIVDEALQKLRDNNKFIGQLFYYQVVVTGLIGGFDDDGVVNYIDFSSFLEPYKALRPKAVAYILQTEYTGGTVKSVPSTVEPIDVSIYPEYLIMDNPHIFYQDGKAYLKIDIMNAMTAAGGFAQVLERQDLEGGTTNAAPKRKKDNKHKSAESDDNEKPNKDGKTK